MSRDLPGPAMSGGELADGRALMSFRDMTPETEIQIATRDGVLGLSVRDVQRWIHSTAPPNECMKFLLTCRLAGVNPFVGEAHLVSYGDRWSTIVDKSGWLRKAQEHPAYAGHEAGIVVQPHKPGDPKSWAGEPREIVGALMPPHCLLVGGWAKVYRHGTVVPTYAAVSMQEYNRAQGSWKSIPCTMIRKVALVQALRESGLIAPGWNDAAEMPAEPVMPGQPAWGRAMPDETIPARAIEVEFAKSSEDAGCPPDVVAAIHQAREALGLPEESDVWRDALSKRGVAHVADLSRFEGWALLTKLRGLMPGGIDQAAPPQATEIATPTLASEPAVSVAPEVINEFTRNPSKTKSQD